MAVDDDELKGVDYVGRPILEIMHHPDYNPKAMFVLNTVLGMTSTQLEDLSIFLGVDNGS